MHITSMRGSFANLSDPGLLCVMQSFEMMAAVVNDQLSGSMKGGMYDNVVADMLAKAGCNLNYWMNDKGNIEIGFRLERNARVVPVGVKASRAAAASLNSMLKRDDVEIGHGLSSGNAGVAGKKVTLPLYMASCLGEPQKLGDHIAKYKNRVTPNTKVASIKSGTPSFLMVLTGSSYAYTRPDGVHVVPLGCLCH